MNLNEAVQKEVDKVIETKLPELINQKVSKLIDDILGDIFKSYSDTGKAIKEKIEKQLDVSLQKFDLVEYNSMVSKAIASQLNKEIDIKPIEELVKNIVGKLEYNSITFEDLLEKTKQIALNDQFNDNDTGKLMLEVTFREEHNWTEIKLGLEKDTLNYVKFLVSTTNNRIFSININDYQKENKEASISDIVNNSDLENFIFQLYNNQVEIIEIDDEYFFDLRYSRHDF